MTKREPMSIRLGDRERSWGTRYGLGLGTQIREDIDTLKHLVRSVDLVGRFADTEIYILVEVLNQYDYQPMTFEALPELLAADTVEYIKLNEELEWKVNELVLYRKLAALTPIEAYKLIHSIRMAWHIEGDFKKAVKMVKEYSL